MSFVNSKPVYHRKRLTRTLSGTKCSAAASEKKDSALEKKRQTQFLPSGQKHCAGGKDAQKANTSSLSSHKQGLDDPETWFDETTGSFTVNEQEF